MRPHMCVLSNVRRKAAQLFTTASSRASFSDCVRRAAGIQLILTGVAGLFAACEKRTNERESPGLAGKDVLVPGTVFSSMHIKKRYTRIGPQKTPQ